MSYVTKEATWPATTLQKGVKEVIARFYELADSKEPDAGPRIANEVFTKDATLVSVSGTFQGFSDISASRDKAWVVVNSRQHSISRVFAGDDKGLELVLLGAVKTGFKNGQVLDSPFACHITVDASSAKSGDPRLKFMEVFAVSRVFGWNLCFI
ncbi:hypothetical protein QBC33DRAFT_502148 [Phialemonium atrogriseum]|uniref:SnoaL-like domain-containing protein n=1 Tax=Phialemonium atrogriseum TaxID=1093897 RepID=A0AAJ0BPI2_9PEZI|nr:uncharacterized protein QBC33DRAFT_502148 [Phialemonium atrogriseum]KAK1761941.1 hypothetical protein QBC33DRAFT_502148 [Phialemonium atrogriseum]